MVSVEFVFNQMKTVIQANLTDEFSHIIQKFSQKTLIPPSSVYFVANGGPLIPELTIEKQMNESNKKNNCIKVLVYSNDDEEEKENEEILIKPKEIICPECYEPCRIKFENYKIKLFDCINGHITENININNFQEKQQINAAKIICEKCKENNKGKTFNNEFYRCLTCQQNFCPLCSNIHLKSNNNHNIISYDNKFYFCEKHNESFIKYCNTCKINICFICEEKEHGEHDIISLGNLIPNENEVNDNLSQIKKTIEIFNEQIQEIIKKLNELSKIMDLYYEINEDILNNYNYKTRNYETLQNINEINLNNSLIEKITEINENNILTDKVYNIFDLYNKIFLDKKELQNLELQQKLKNKGNQNQKNKDIIYKTISIIK